MDREGRLRNALLPRSEELESPSERSFPLSLELCKSSEAPGLDTGVLDIEPRLAAEAGVSREEVNWPAEFLGVNVDEDACLVIVDEEDGCLVNLVDGTPIAEGVGIPVRLIVAVLGFVGDFNVLVAFDSGGRDGDFVGDLRTWD